MAQEEGRKEMPQRPRVRRVRRGQTARAIAGTMKARNADPAPSREVGRTNDGNPIRGAR
jgi:hypothetical protein